MRIAILEDDAAQSETLGQWFRDLGDDVHIFDDPKDFVRMAGRGSFDIILIDWMPPEMTSDSVLRWLQGRSFK